jgi:hypothetical protein
MANYDSYLLRIWNQESGPENKWRATLESTATHQVHCFSCMEGLFRYLDSCAGKGTEDLEDSFRSRSPDRAVPDESSQECP